MAPEIIRDLGDGLVMRRAMPEDADALAALTGEVFSEEGTGQPNVNTAAWTRDLVRGPHPTVQRGDVLLVEDTRAGRFVSTLCLIPQTWSYGGVEFGVGRVEAVATRPEYRNRGLIRAQFEEIHRMSAERGHLLQAITGIPWFYRQFGYEMALTLSAGRFAYAASVPKLREGEAEPYRVRPATADDLPFIADVYAQGAKRSLVSCVRDEAIWRYELSGRSAENPDRLELRVIETRESQAVGFLAHSPSVHGGQLAFVAYELAPGVTWSAVTPSVVRYAYATGQEYAERDRKELASYAFWLGERHPAFQVASACFPGTRWPYAWYVRVADLPAFLRRIAPVLERRLAESFLAGHTGDLPLNFYRSGIRLAFDRGRLASVEPWQPQGRDRGTARFPGLTFLQMLLGYRSADELEYAHADCRVRDDAVRALAETLFPKQPSTVWPVV